MLVGNAVKYEAHLEDGKLVGKSDGVEFTVREGQCIQTFLSDYCFVLLSI